MTHSTHIYTQIATSLGGSQKNTHIYIYIYIYIQQIHTFHTFIQSINNTTPTHQHIINTKKNSSIEKQNKTKSNQIKSNHSFIPFNHSKSNSKVHRIIKIHRIHETAHKFANEIIFRLGGGIAGIAESKIYFVSNRSGHKEIWEMDYDGENQHAVTHLGSISLSPRISPDGARLAFSSLTGTGWEILMYSFDLNRMVAFPKFGGTNTSPAWSPDGAKLAFSASRGGTSEIDVVDASGANRKRLTSAKSPEVGPVWNRKTGTQLAWASGRSGLPQIYTMDSDGANVQRFTDEGYAVSPSWSPNGQFLLFSWVRHYGPGSARGGGHLHHGHHQQAVGTVDP